MSAIFGIIDFAGHPIDPEWIKSMQTDLAHRGPDGQGLYEENGVVLGHMLLQVTPESIYDKSPYEEDGFVITANARLDERKAIMDRLNVDPTERGKITDPLLLLRSFRKFGKDFVKDIYGDFAFAIWDKNKKELFCARDQMGVKPFLYFFIENRFVFSTEIKALIRLPLIKKEINQRNLLEQSIEIFNNANLTAWVNIYRLVAANIISVNKIQIVNKLYWAPSYKRNLQYNDEEKSRKKMQELLLKVIADHTHVNGDIGVPLSGGLDSSTIACLAARKLMEKNKKLITASSVFDPENSISDEKDETEFISEILRHEPNIEPTFVFHSNMSFLRNQVLKFERHYSTFNPYNYVDEALYEKFESKSIRRVLSGYLGDFTVSNSVINPLPHLLLTGEFKVFHKLCSHIKKKLKISSFTLITSYILKPIAPISFLKIWHKLKGISPVWSLDSFPLLLKRKEKKKILKLLFKMQNKYSLKISDNIWLMISDPFNEDWDCGSSHHQIEMTYPLIDRRLVEFLLQLPVEHFYAEGLPRGLIRKAMKGILPEKIRTRRDKGPYSPGFNYILQNEILSIIPQLENKFIKMNLGNLVDLPKISSLIKDLSNSKNSDKKNIKFVPINFSLLTLCNMISFNYWYNNKINK